jgi:hypothetical protein
MDEANAIVGDTFTGRVPARVAKHRRIGLTAVKAKPRPQTCAEASGR